MSFFILKFSFPTPHKSCFHKVDEKKLQKTKSSAEPDLPEDVLSVLKKGYAMEDLIPSMADGSRFLRMKDTEIANTFLTNPQHQNTAGNVFGGFLLERAYDLAYSNAYIIGGAGAGKRPVGFLGMGEV